MKKITYFLSFLLLFSLPLNAKNLEQKLSVNIGLFDAARVTMLYSLDDKSYAFSSQVATAGLFGKLYSFNAVYSTKGKILNNKFIAQDYNYISKSKSHTRTKRLVFDDFGKLLERISKKDKKEKKVKIKQTGEFFDFNDLQSVFAYLAKKLQDNNLCDMKKEVFDGKKKYKISIEDKGETILDDKDVEYKGRAKKCSIFIKRTDYEDEDLLFDNTSDRPISVWIAYKEKMPFVAKIEIDSTPLGKLKAYTTDVNIKE